MNPARGYIGIDRFRIIAAVLVVAVHTSPLTIFGALPDFIFARIIARIGVPFFFAATGFFLLAPYAANPKSDPKPIGRFVLKTIAVYIACIIFYLPVNLYAEQWSGINSIWQALKMILVDGTIYHLWYLPAAIFSVPFIWLLLRFCSMKIVSAAAVLLYAVGLFGDSYYGLAASVPFFNSLYQGLFTVTDYTRSGLFFAPIFLLTGVFASKLGTQRRIISVVGVCVSLTLLLTEGILIYFAGTARHDSMYIMLPACILFLLLLLITFNGASSKPVRTASMLVYILHPVMIIALRGAAKWLGLERVLVDNSIVHFAVVCILSFGAATVLTALITALEKRRYPRQPPRRAWMEIDLKALDSNTQVLKSLLPRGCKLMPAVKANAYGFGAVPVVKALYRFGVRDFCVASLHEGIELRRHGVRGNILILGYTSPDDCRLIKRYRLIQTVVDYRHGVMLAEKNMSVPVHIKLDTGMHRLGERSEQTDRIIELFGQKGIKIRSVFTQLSCSDSVLQKDVEYTHMQLASFNACLDEISAHGIALPERHIQCSYGIINYPEIRGDYARPGLAIYGIVDENCCLGPVPDLKPIFTVKTRIALVKNIYAGERVGYGTGFTAHNDMRVAVIMMGFGDGLPRSLSNGAGRVMLHGEYAPIVGNICMDQAMIDISNIESVAAGDEVIVIGTGEISVVKFAERAGTIPNEIVSCLGRRLERKYI